MIGRIRLITRADDAGSCEDANLAIAEALDAGILKNVSVMAPGPALQHASEVLAHRKDVCFGLHVTLNAEWDRVKWGPVSPGGEVATLTDDNGHFYPNPATLANHDFDPTEAIREIRAQLDACRKAGFDIRYVDEHMGVGWVKNLRQRIARIAEEEGLIDFHGFSHLPVKGRVSDAGQLLGHLEQADPGTYVFVTHPGIDGDSMRMFEHDGLAPGQIALERDEDRLLWLDERLKRAVASNAFEPITYADAALSEKR